MSKETGESIVQTHRRLFTHYKYRRKSCIPLRNGGASYSHQTYLCKFSKKKAKLVSYEPQSTDDKEEKPKNTKTLEDKDPYNKIKSPHKEEMHKTCCCQDGSCPMMGNNVHKCEVYDPPPEVKDFVCRNYIPGSPEITDKVPEDVSSARLYMPNYTQEYYGPANPSYPIRGSYYPRWYPERPQAQYGYYPPPRRPQPPYGYY